MYEENQLLLKNHSPLKEAYQLVLKEKYEDDAEEATNYYIELMEKFCTKPIIKVLEIYPINEQSFQISLRKAGYEVTSIALDMGINAFGGEQDGDHFIIGKDFQFPSLKNTFDAILITHGSFGKFVSSSKSKEFLNQISKYLEKKGLIVFEFWHLPGVEKGVTDEKGFKDWEKINSTKDGSILRFTNSKLHLESSILSVDVHYIIEKGKYIQKFNESHAWRMYTLSEIDLLLGNENLQLIKAFKFPTQEEPEFSSFRLISICEKP